MDSREKVLAVWPEAKHTYHGSIMGDYIWEDGSGNSPKLGSGDTEQAAWDDASRIFRL